MSRPSPGRGPRGPQAPGSEGTGSTMTCVRGHSRLAASTRHPARSIVSTAPKCPGQPRHPTAWERRRNEHRRRKDEYNEYVTSCQGAGETVPNQGVIPRRTIKKFFGKEVRLRYRPTVESSRPSIESRGTISSAESLRRGPCLQRPDRRVFDNRLEPRPGRKRPSCSRCEGSICPRQRPRRSGCRGHDRCRQCRFRRSLGRLHRGLGLFLGGLLRSFLFGRPRGGLFLGRLPLCGNLLLRSFLLRC